MRACISSSGALQIRHGEESSERVNCCVRKSDIKAVKILSPNSSAPGSLTPENQSPETSENAQKSEIIDGPRSAFSLLVRLSSGELLK